MIEEFYSSSGLKLNSHKSKLMKIGRHIQDDIGTPFEIVDKIKIVNVCFCFCLFLIEKGLLT